MAEGPPVVRARRPLAEAGRRLAERVRRVAAERGAARLAIPGGSAAGAIAPARSALGSAWGHVRLTWVDERCVPFSSPESNRGAAHRAGWLDPAHAPAVEFPLFCDGESGDEAVARVEAGLDAYFDGGLDVLLLGMGEDGHIASLFPGGAAFPAEARAAFVPESPKPPPERITLTRRILASARAGVLLATGESKRAALERLAAGDPSLPAQGLPGLVIVTDLDLGGDA